MIEVYIDLMDILMPFSQSYDKIKGEGSSRASVNKVWGIVKNNFGPEFLKNIPFGEEQKEVWDDVHTCLLSLEYPYTVTVILGGQCNSLLPQLMQWVCTNLPGGVGVKSILSAHKTQLVATLVQEQQQQQQQQQRTMFLLLDDNSAQCEAWRKAGGAAVRIPPIRDRVSHQQWYSEFQNEVLSFIAPVTAAKRPREKGLNVGEDKEGEEEEEEDEEEEDSERIDNRALSEYSHLPGDLKELLENDEGGIEDTVLTNGAVAGSSCVSGAHSGGISSQQQSESEEVQQQQLEEESIPTRVLDVAKFLLALLERLVGLPEGKLPSDTKSPLDFAKVFLPLEGCRDEEERRQCLCRTVVLYLHKQRLPHVLTSDTMVENLLTHLGAGSLEDYKHSRGALKLSSNFALAAGNNLTVLINTSWHNYRVKLSDAVRNFRSRSGKEHMELALNPDAPIYTKELHDLESMARNARVYFKVFTPKHLEREAIYFQTIFHTQKHVLAVVSGMDWLRLALPHLRRIDPNSYEEKMKGTNTVYGYFGDPVTLPEVERYESRRNDILMRCNAVTDFLCHLGQYVITRDQSDKVVSSGDYESVYASTFELANRVMEVSKDMTEHDALEWLIAKMKSNSFLYYRETDSMDFTDADYNKLPKDYRTAGILEAVPYYPVVCGLLAALAGISKLAHQIRTLENKGGNKNPTRTMRGAKNVAEKEPKVDLDSLPFNADQLDALCLQIGFLLLQSTTTMDYHYKESGGSKLQYVAKVVTAPAVGFVWDYVEKSLTRLRRKSPSSPRDPDPVLIAALGLANTFMKRSHYLFPEAPAIECKLFKELTKRKDAATSANSQSSCDSSRNQYSAIAVTTDAKLFTAFRRHDSRDEKLALRIQGDNERKGINGRKAYSPPTEAELSVPWKVFISVSKTAKENSVEVVGTGQSIADSNNPPDKLNVEEMATVRILQALARHHIERLRKEDKRASSSSSSSSLERQFCSAKTWEECAPGAHIKQWIRWPQLRSDDRSTPEAKLTADVGSAAAQLTPGWAAVSTGQHLWCNLVTALAPAVVFDRTVPYAYPRAFSINSLVLAAYEGLGMPCNAAPYGDFIVYGMGGVPYPSMCAQGEQGFWKQREAAFEARLVEIRAMSPRELYNAVMVGGNSSTRSGNSNNIRYGSSDHSTRMPQAKREECARFAACLGGYRAAALVKGLLKWPETFMKKGGPDLVFYRTDILEMADADGDGGGGGGRQLHPLASVPAGAPCYCSSSSSTGGATDALRMTEGASEDCFSAVGASPADDGARNEKVKRRLEKVWEGDTVFAVEVKSESDTLGGNQIQWLQLLLGAGILALEYKVHHSWSVQMAASCTNKKQKLASE